VGDRAGIDGPRGVSSSRRPQRLWNNVHDRANLLYANGDRSSLDNSPFQYYNINGLGFEAIGYSDCNCIWLPCYEVLGRLAVAKSRNVYK